MRVFSREVRMYVKLYRAMVSLDMNEEELEVNKHHLATAGAMKLYSRMKKKCKTHQSALDMNLADI